MRTVGCPHCGKAAPFNAQNRWRPFCSERCKMIDLGLWASERYRMPDDEPESPDDASPKRGES